MLELAESTNTELKKQVDSVKSELSSIKEERDVFKLELDAGKKDVDKFKSDYISSLLNTSIIDLLTDILFGVESSAPYSCLLN